MKRKGLLLIPLLAFSLSSCDFPGALIPKQVTLTSNYELVAVGGSVQLRASYLGSSDSLIWSSSNENIATVDQNGLVNVIDNASNVGKSIIITVKTSNGIAKGTCEIKVGSLPTCSLDYTIMIYMCGSTLEWDQDYYNQMVEDKGQIYADNHISEYEYAASADLAEILSLSIPSNVKIVVETGGSTKWKKSSNYSQDISTRKLQRWEVKDKKLTYVCDSTNPNNMGSKDELTDFLNWGIKNYSATNMSLILWDHGAGIGGVCFDSNSNDYLSTSEVYDACRKALDLNNRDKFTWIGYDACLMNVVDIASVNADNFEYMIAAQESEAGEGWAYDKWLPDLIENANIPTDELLDKIASSFVSTIHGLYCSNNRHCDATLSVLDLKKMPEFISAFNNATSIYNTKDDFNIIVAAMKNSLEFGFYYDEEDDSSSYNYGLVDLKDIFTNLGIYSTEMENALNDLVIKNYYCSRMNTKPCGISVFVAATHIVKESQNYDISHLEVLKSDYKNANSSRLTAWQDFMLKKGEANFYIPRY